jgi:hypothetical protein
VDYFLPTEGETKGHWILELVARAHDRIHSKIGHDPDQEEKMPGETGVEGAVATRVN